MFSSIELPPVGVVSLEAQVPYKPRMREFQYLTNRILKNRGVLSGWL